MYYPSSMSIFRENYKTRKDYLTAYHDCCKHYGFKVMVVNGWKFFEFESDYIIWKHQK